MLPGQWANIDPECIISISSSATHFPKALVMFVATLLSTGWNPLQARNGILVPLSRYLQLHLHQNLQRIAAVKCISTPGWS